MANCTFPRHAFAFTGGSRGKWEFPIKRWEGMRKVRLIMYSVVCTKNKNACESAHLFCGENSAPLISRCKPGYWFMPPSEMAAVRERRRHRPRRRTERIFATRITLFQLSEHRIVFVSVSNSGLV